MKPTVLARLKAGVALAAVAAQLGLLAGPASAFCGFYVAKIDGKLFNKSSKVVLVRDGEHTAITMASDYEGEPKEFALVVPVPTFIERNQIGVVEPATLDHLDAYTAPRLVQYFDPDPCRPPVVVSFADRMMSAATKAIQPAPPSKLAYAGVKVEARYDVAEYDVVILSADESDGLARWLADNGYKIPAGAEPVLASYIKQKMRFFVAKVNLARMQEIGKAYLRPLQVRYDTAKFMLPLRLGTVNANGPQDLIVFALSKKGRVEAANYRTVKMPSNVEVPLFVRGDFANVYKAAFEHAVARENMRGVFVEYAWDTGWCDPCAAEPLTDTELRSLGVDANGGNGTFVGRMPPPPGGDFITRLHLRYDAKSFPEDLNFIETSDRENFQGRYVLQIPNANTSCPAGAAYLNWLPVRFKKEAQTLADITGWPQRDIEARMAATGEAIAGAANPGLR